MSLHLTPELYLQVNSSVSSRGQPGQRKQIWCVSCTCPCAHFIKNSFAHGVYEKARSLSNNTYAKAKENPNTSLYAVCCLIDLFETEKIYNYKSLKRAMMKTIPLNSPQKKNSVFSHLNDHCCYRSALRELPGTSVLYRPPANHSFTLSGHSGAASCMY